VQKLRGIVNCSLNFNPMEETRKTDHQEIQEALKVMKLTREEIV
jgi:hypothetical protein